MSQRMDAAMMMFCLRRPKYCSGYCFHCHLRHCLCCCCLLSLDSPEEVDDGLLEELLGGEIEDVGDGADGGDDCGDCDGVGKRQRWHWRSLTKTWPMAHRLDHGPWPPMEERRLLCSALLLDVGAATATAATAAGAGAAR